MKPVLPATSPSWALVDEDFLGLFAAVGIACHYRYGADRQG